VKVCILDCYSDEPAGLGVPPYLGVTPRYVFGAVVEAGSEARYINIDDIRAFWGRPHEAINLTRTVEQVASILRWADVFVVLGGSHTPGRYLRGRPAVPKEISRFVTGVRGTVFVGGPISESTMGGGRGFRINTEILGSPDSLVLGDPEAFVYEFLTTHTIPGIPLLRDYEKLDAFAIRGAEILRQVTPKPDMVLEVETSRGCTRAVSGGCSFCSECSRYGLPTFREEQSIVAEIHRLRDLGARNIRLGRQACFFSYRSRGVGEEEIPKPNPTAVENLLSACSRLRLNSLHIDNVNPAVVAKHSEESRRIAKSIVRYCTPGNVAALGVETADPRVVRRNNLKAMPDESLEAIRLISDLGARTGWNGQPAFLPGINLVLGLPGETRETYRLNLEFLQSILDAGLLVRRINIRRLIPVRGTQLWGRRWNQRAMERESRQFVKGVRTSIDRPMLRRVFPVGTILRGLVAEVQNGRTTFCRFPGSYPVVVGIWGRISPGTILDGFVLDHGYRSLTAVRFPLDLNACSAAELELFPGIGRQRSARILRSRPLHSPTELKASLARDPPDSACLGLLLRASQGDDRPSEP